MSKVQPRPSCQLRGKGESSMDPAEGVEHILWNSGDVALDGIADVLVGGLEKTGDAENCECVLVMESEGCVVNQTISGF